MKYILAYILTFILLCSGTTLLVLIAVGLSTLIKLLGWPVYIILILALLAIPWSVPFKERYLD